MSERENIPPGAAEWQAPGEGSKGDEGGIGETVAELSKRFARQRAEKKSEEVSDVSRDIRERGYALERQIMTMADQLFKDYEKAKALRQGAEVAGDGVSVGEATLAEMSSGDAILKLREVFKQLAKRLEAEKKSPGGV